MTSEASDMTLSDARELLTMMAEVGDTSDFLSTAVRLVETELDARDATIARLVSALKTIGMHPYFIDAILADPGAAPATEEKS